MATRPALYPQGLRSQRQGLADLLGLHHDLVAEISQRRALGVLVERAVAREPLAAVVHEVAERGRVLDVARGTALAVTPLRHDLFVLEKLAVLVAVDRRALIIVAVMNGEHALLLRVRHLDDERECP